MIPPVLGYPNDQIPLFLFVYAKEGDAPGVLTQSVVTAIDP